MPAILEYVWIDVKGDMRSKARTVFDRINIENISQILDWNFDGSSTGQANGNDSETILKPIVYYKDPFRNNIYTCSNESLQASRYTNCYLVLCECYDKHGNPLESNTRHSAKNIFDMDIVMKSQIWYGIEQEYVLYDNTTNRLLGWPLHGEPELQGKYYCGVGADRTFGRDIAEDLIRINSEE